MKHDDEWLESHLTGYAELELICMHNCATEYAEHIHKPLLERIAELESRVEWWTNRERENEKMLA